PGARRPRLRLQAGGAGRARPERRASPTGRARGRAEAGLTGPPRSRGEAVENELETPWITLTRLVPAVRRSKYYSWRGRHPAGLACSAPGHSPFDVTFSVFAAGQFTLVFNGRSRTQTGPALRTHQGAGRSGRRSPLSGGGGARASPHQGGRGGARHGHRARRGSRRQAPE